MAIYYIDNQLGNNENDGLTPETPKAHFSAITQEAGDTLLFKRGNFYREKLTTEKCVSYGAYGEGERPVFCVSTDVSDPENWVETETKNVWRCVKPIFRSVGNFIFNEDECTAALRWTKEELSEQGDFWDSRYTQEKDPPPQELLMYSEGNPGEVYSHIEAASYANRHCGDLKCGTSFEGLHFKNSGVHALAGQGDDITIRDCVFENIGGCAWSVPLHVRFGNAVEIWEKGNNITVENCYFKNVYDSCVTHQGPGKHTQPTHNFICRNNTFDTYGMAAFEYRDQMPVDSAFTNNVCLNAGCGFAMLGEGLPRLSEIYPQPMGHHIFLWRIPLPGEGGNLLIAENEFGPAPVGAAIYSIVSSEAEAQMTLRNNKYTRNDVLLNRFGGENFTDLEEYKAKTGKDEGSAYLD